jgi:predicted HNH restriction endonuclease
MNKEQLQQQIKEQEEKNINLFNIFQYRLQDKELQPLIQEWREGSKKLRILDDALYQLEMKERDEKLTNEDNKKETKTFVNGYGEATNKYITCSTYERAEKRRQKEVLSFMGRR